MTTIPNIDFSDGIVKKELHVFYLLDVSGSMAGTAIAQLNQGIKSTIDALRQKLGDSTESHLKISIMRFSSGAAWITGTPESDYSEYIEDFTDIPELQAAGLTHLGAALRLLEKGLSRNTMLKSVTGNRKPIIIVMTDGMPTDDWESALQSINNNRWFQQSTKIGIALGDQADENVLAKVVGNHEGVVRVTDISLFADMLVEVSVTSSLLNSGSVINSVNPSTNPQTQPSKSTIPVQTAPINSTVVNQTLPIQNNPFDDSELE